MENEEIVEITEETVEAAEPEKVYTQVELDEILEGERKRFDEKLAEAEKLAGMGESEKADYKRELAEKNLAEREAAVAKRELMADANEKLSALGLPKQLASCLSYESAEACETSIKQVSEAFSIAVREAVNERIMSNAPKFNYVSGSDAFLDGLGL